MELILSFIKQYAPTVISVLSALAALFITLEWLRMSRVRAYYAKYGITGPTPLPFIGNMITMGFKGRSKLEEKWRNTYGKIYLTFLGGSTRLTISDAEVMREICISNFDKFTNTKFPGTTEEFQRNTLFLLKNERWRKVRSLMTPAFTSGKIKRMFKMLEETSDHLVEFFKSAIKKSPINKDETPIDSEAIYRLYAMDGIARCAFAVTIDSKGETDIDKIRKSSKLVDALIGFMNFPFWSQVLTIIIPLSIARQITSFYKLREGYLECLNNHTKAVVKAREGKHDKYDDILSSLANARLGEKLEFVNNTEKDLESHHEGYNAKDKSFEQMYNEMCTSVANDQETKVEKSASLTEMEFFANSALLLVVGTRTTKEFLQSVSYCLAFHQDIQQRLYEELISIRKTDDKGSHYFDYETLIPNQYLDAVVSETLRLYGAVIFVNRECSEDFYVKKYNFTIKKGDVLHLCIHNLHTDPDYWYEPQKFDPERFMPGNKEKIVPGSYCPFGLGPRQCVGMRFSLTESKLAIAKVITNFKLVPEQGKIYPAEEGYSSFLRSMNDSRISIKLR